MAVLLFQPDANGGVAVHSNFLLELHSAHCSTGCLQEPSLSGGLEM